MLKTIIIAVFSTFLASSPVSAQHVNISTIVGVCDEDESGLCLFYISGVVSGLFWAAEVSAKEIVGEFSEQSRRMSTREFLKACPPANASGNQFFAVSLSYIRKHPELWHLPAPLVINDGLKEAFPCR